MNIWPRCIIQVFVLLAAFNVWLYWIAAASSDRSALITSHPYEDGLEFQQTLDRRNRFADAGWAAEMALDAAGVLTVEITDQRHTGVTGLTASAHTVYLADSHHDADVELAADSSVIGRFRGRLPPAPGLRQLAIRLSRDGETFEVARQVLAAPNPR